MPTAVTEAPYRPVSAEPTRKRWTRAECEALEATGLLDQQNLELVDGELISRMGKKRPHVNVLTFVQEWLIEVFGKESSTPKRPLT